MDCWDLEGLGVLNGIPADLYSREVSDTGNNKSGQSSDLSAAYFCMLTLQRALFSESSTSEFLLVPSHTSNIL